MNKKNIYLDTSFISYLEQDDTPDKKLETNDLWFLFTHRKDVSLYISDVTITEIKKCNEYKRNILMNRMSEQDINIILESKKDIELADLYLSNEVLTNKSYDDLRHIAIAVRNGCKYILSWNFKHFVNPKTIDAVNCINKQYDLPCVHIVSPSMMLGGF